MASFHDVLDAIKKNDEHALAGLLDCHSASTARKVKQLKSDTCHIRDDLIALLAFPFLFSGLTVGQFTKLLPIAAYDEIRQYLRKIYELWSMMPPEIKIDGLSVAHLEGLSPRFSMCDQKRIKHWIETLDLSKERKHTLIDSLCSLPRIVTLRTLLQDINLMTVCCKTLQAVFPFREVQSVSTAQSSGKMSLRQNIVGPEIGKDEKIPTSVYFDYAELLVACVQQYALHSSIDNAAQQIRQRAAYLRLRKSSAEETAEEIADSSRADDKRAEDYSGLVLSTDDLQSSVMPTQCSERSELPITDTENPSRRDRPWRKRFKRCFRDRQTGDIGALTLRNITRQKHVEPLRYVTCVGMIVACIMPFIDMKLVWNHAESNKKQAMGVAPGEHAPRRDETKMHQSKVDTQYERARPDLTLELSLWKALITQTPVLKSVHDILWKHTTSALGGHTASPGSSVFDVIRYVHNRFPCLTEPDYDRCTKDSACKVPDDGGFWGSEFDNDKYANISEPPTTNITAVKNDHVSSAEVQRLSAIEDRIRKDIKQLASTRDDLLLEIHSLRNTKVQLQRDKLQLDMDVDARRRQIASLAITSLLQ